MKKRIRRLLLLAGAVTLGSCGSKGDASREEAIEGAKEAIKSNANYDASENKLVIYQQSDNTLGDVSVKAEPKEEAVISVATRISFYQPYSQCARRGDLVLDLYAKTDYRYNVTFAISSSWDDSLSAFPFMYSIDAKVGEDYEKASDKYQVLADNYKNQNDCPWTKGDCQELFDSFLVLTFESVKTFFDENNLDFSTLYPNY